MCIMYSDGGPLSQDSYRKGHSPTYLSEGCLPLGATAKCNMRTREVFYYSTHPWMWQRGLTPNNLTKKRKEKLNVQTPHSTSAGRKALKKTDTIN